MSKQDRTCPNALDRLLKLAVGTNEEFGSYSWQASPVRQPLLEARNLAAELIGKQRKSGQNVVGNNESRLNASFIPSNKFIVGGQHTP
jgi:hypothetical protein